MANRYSSLNRRPGAAASGLFADYPGSRPSSSSSQNRPSYAYSDPNRSASPYYSQQQPPQSQPYASSSNQFSSSPFQPARNDNSTSDSSKGKNNTYTSTAVLDHLEAQNDNETSILSSKVSQLKQLTIAIGDEIRESSSLAQTINDSFENTSVRLKGTMRRMLRMAERTGVGWKVWLGFFVAVWLIFFYVWLF